MASQREIEAAAEVVKLLTLLADPVKYQAMLADMKAAADRLQEANVVAKTVEQADAYSAAQAELLQKMAADLKVREADVEAREKQSQEKAATWRNELVAREEALSLREEATATLNKSLEDLIKKEAVKVADLDRALKSAEDQRVELAALQKTLDAKAEALKNILG